MKGKILEIIEKHWTNHLYPMQNILDCASEIESLIKGNYVEWDFVKWAIIDQEIFFGDLSETIILNDNPEKFKTLKEVYEYWQTQIKKDNEN